MSRKDKLLDRLQNKPNDFSWKEVVSLMNNCGFKLLKNKGSRRKFYNKEKDLLINLHEPHPEKTIKLWVVNDLIEILKSAGEIKDG